MRISDYDFELPESLIAQQPVEPRDASRMLVVDRMEGKFRDDRFSNLPELLSAGDILVLNNTKVFPARLIGQSESGARAELFLIRELSDGKWEALAKPLRRLRPGKTVNFGDLLAARIVEKTPDARVVVEFDLEGDFNEALNRVGKTPLPPYIKRGDETDADRERYQTVFARTAGAIAAPTAGLHFTPAILEALKEKGIETVEVTLHVGYGTFEPVRVDDLAQHRVMPERAEISESAADRLNLAKTENRRLIAVGTTSTRTLESNFRKHGRFAAESALADLTVTPGYKFAAIDGLLTNFHLPKSSLLVLVSTFAGRQTIMDAYRHAVRSGYRFYSYGDCMLII